MAETERRLLALVRANNEHNSHLATPLHGDRHWVIAPYICMGPELQGDEQDTQFITENNITHVLDTTYGRSEANFPLAPRRLLAEHDVRVELLGVSGGKSPPNAIAFVGIIRSIIAHIAPGHSTRFALYIQDTALRTGAMAVAMAILAAHTSASFSAVQTHALQNFISTGDRLAFVAEVPDMQGKTQKRDSEGRLLFKVVSFRENSFGKPAQHLPYGARLNPFIADMCNNRIRQRTIAQQALPDGGWISSHTTHIERFGQGTATRTWAAPSQISTPCIGSNSRRHLPEFGEDTEEEEEDTTQRRSSRGNKRGSHSLEDALYGEPEPGNRRSFQRSDSERLF